MKELLKFVTCGSVDDGKSTLIGHLLYDAKLLYTDQKQALELESKIGSREGELDYSLLLDGLMAEREQGITIDVAYRYFSTDKRSFIVADAPGHEEYTRNMAVGASFARLAVILVDVTQGILLQTRRHATICALFGICNFVFVLNKMDLVNYSQDAFDKAQDEIRKLSSDLGLEQVICIPVSATEGDNVVYPSENMKWYTNQPLLEYLECVKTENGTEEEGFVMPVQRVCRPNHTFRGFQGTVISGKIAVGDSITVLPSGEISGVQALLCADKRVQQVKAGQAATIQLEKEIDVSRGCVLANKTELKRTNMFNANILWMDEQALVQGRTFLMKLGTKTVSAVVMAIQYKLDINTGKQLRVQKVCKNEIAVCDFVLSEKTVFSSFKAHRALGRFILIDRFNNMTSACGIINHHLRCSENLTWQKLDITRELRAEKMQQKPVTIWFTGLSGSGKSTLANELEKALNMDGKYSMLLDGDNVRMGLSKDLGFEEKDRIENIRRIAEVSKLMNDAGLIVITSFISPYHNDRQNARAVIGTENFIEVYVNTPLEVCEERDVKGLYQKARNGEIPNFTGISSPFEMPKNAEITIDTTNRSIEACIRQLLDELQKQINK